MESIYLREATLTFRTVKRTPRNHFNLTVIRASTDAARMLRPILENRFTESIVVLALNGRHAVLGYHEVARGSHNACYCTAAEVFRFPLLAGAAAIILAHNHPSGSSTPSTEDIALTRRVIEAGTLLGIPVLDHVILGTDHYSMLDQGVVDFDQPRTRSAAAEGTR